MTASAAADAPMADAGPAGAELPLLRDPHMEFHERIKEGTKSPLTIRLSEALAATGATLRLAVPAGKKSIKVKVYLHAPNFEVDGPPEGTITVGRRHDPAKERVTFQLTALSPGPEPKSCDIRAGFWLGNRCIGSVTHWTRIVPKHVSEDAVTPDGRAEVEPFAVGTARRQDPDLRISVSSSKHDGEPPYRIKLDCQMVGHEIVDQDCGEFKLPKSLGKDLTAYITSIAEKHISKAPDREDPPADWRKWEATFAGALGDLGRKLWDWLPGGFRQAYLDLVAKGAKPNSIMIVSNELALPWELVWPVRPSGDSSDLKSFGQMHALGRWLPQKQIKPQPQHRAIKRFLVLNPKYEEPLDWSEREAVAIKALVGKAEVVKPATLAQVERKVLQSTDLHFLHFTGHGEYDEANADLSSLLLENGEDLDANKMASQPMGRQGQPFVYLNACSVGAVGLVVGRSGGFVSALLNDGCSGIVAPYWPVHDESAMKFSTSLYGKLKGGLTWGEALRQLRAEHPKNPTMQAYAYYGDPLAKCDFQ